MKVVPKLAHTRSSLVRNKMNKSGYKTALKEKRFKNDILKPVSDSNLRANVKIVLRKEGKEALNYLADKNPELYDVIVKEMMKKEGHFKTLIGTNLYVRLESREN